MFIYYFYWIYQEYTEYSLSLRKKRENFEYLKTILSHSSHTQTYMCINIYIHKQFILSFFIDFIFTIFDHSWILEFFWLVHVFLELDCSELYKFL